MTKKQELNATYKVNDFVKVSVNGTWYIGIIREVKRKGITVDYTKNQHANFYNHRGPSGVFTTDKIQKL